MEKTTIIKLAGAREAGVKWYTGNKKIAIVKEGRIYPKSTGNATITAKYKGKTYKCSVNRKR